MRDPPADHRRTAVDRRAQYLPVPLGGMSAVHAPPVASQSRLLLRRKGPATAMAVGVSAAIAGLVLLALRGPVAVYANGRVLHVGGNVLTIERSTATTTLYNGDAAYLLTMEQDGSVIGTAAWTGSGPGSSNVCVMRDQPSRIVETCRFDDADVTITSVDSYVLAAPGAWHRTYADGQQVTIAVPSDGVLVPVPFPIGR